MNAPISLADLREAYVKGVIYGGTGAGKSVLLGSSQYYPTFFFDVDRGIESVRAWPKTRYDLVRVWPTPSYQEFCTAFDWLEKYLVPGQLVVVDTATELQRIILQELIDSKGKNTIATQQEWGAALLMMEHLARRFRNMPAHVIWLTHETQGTDPETGYNTWRPSFQGQFATQYGKHFGLIARYQLLNEQRIDAATNTRQTITHRFLNCQRDQMTEAKDRSNSLQKFMAPDIDAILGTYLAGIMRTGGQSA